MEEWKARGSSGGLSVNKVLKVFRVARHKEKHAATLNRQGGLTAKKESPNCLKLSL